MMDKKKIHEMLAGYDRKKIKIATVCSHSALQIFHGARAEGFKTIGIVTKEKKAIYDAFPNAAPDEYMVVDDISEIPVDELAAQNAILVPHGSLVEYPKLKVEDMKIPIFGNRASLSFERSRGKMFEWMKEAGLKVPKTFQPDEIDRPCIVKTEGAKGGYGYKVVKTPEEFYRRVKEREGMIIQEYLVGIRVYPHFFYSPLGKTGYPAGKGRLELMSMDRRVETNVDELYRTMSVDVWVDPSFRIVGNEPIVIRESMLSDIFNIGKGVSESADRLFGGMPGPFCVELVINDRLELYAFEISARIVAGTNIFPEGSFYSAYSYSKPMSTGRRIAAEIRAGLDQSKLEKIIY